MFTQTPTRSRWSPLASLREGWDRFMELYVLLGKKFLCITILVEHVLQAFVAGGGSGGLIGAPILLILSSFNLPATRMQILETVAMSPWQLKPIVGMLSDGLYIGGYNKMPYMIVTALTGMLSAVALVSFFPVSELHFTLFVFFIVLPISTSDLLLEARYVEKTRDNSDARHTLKTFIHFCSGICQLLSIGVVGLLIMYKVPLEWLYLSPVLPFLLVAVLTYANWIGESMYNNARPLTNVLCNCCWFKDYRFTSIDRKNASPLERMEPSESSKFNYITRTTPVIAIDTEKIKENWKVVLLAVIIGSTSILTSMMGILELSTTSLFFASLFCEFLMIACFYALLERRVAKILTFMVIQNMFSISLRAATFFFYTDPVEAYPEGPHFTRQFYVSVMGGLGILVSLVGVFIYGAFMHNAKYRLIFAITTILFMIACIPDILLFQRWNIAVGIPDTTFVLGSEVAKVIIGELNAMPFGVLMLGLCKLSPGMEASLYAIMAGASNLGGAFSSYKGAAVLEWLDIRPSGNMTGESHQFDKLYIASAISLVIQIVPFFAIWFLVPNARQSDDVLIIDELETEMEEEVDITKKANTLFHNFDFIKEDEEEEEEEVHNTISLL